jgi:tetratricopeptide (TPR) repeat protein
LAIGRLEPREAATRLRQRPLAVQKYVQAILLECLTWVPEKEVRQRQWLAAVLEADPWLAQFRQAREQRAWAELEKLTAQMEVGRYHPAVLVVLARTLRDAARAGELLLRRTQQQFPGDFWVNHALAQELYGSNEALAFFRVAVGVRPGNAPAHNNLGLVLYAQVDVPGAMACYKQALALDPKLAQAHNNLGAALQAQGDLKGAIACHRKALALDPKYANAHNNLGMVLYAQGDVKGALDHYQKALALDPKFANAHGALGEALLAQGRFAEARASSQRAYDLLPPKDPLRPYVTRQLRDCQRLLDLDTRLSTLLKGDDQPKDTAEQLALAELCQRYKKRYVAAARFYTDAFAAGATRSSQRTYNASCAAILAAAGKGEDAAKLDAKEKTRLREQALAWLKNALKILDKLVGDPERRDEVRQKLQHWQQDADLASVRDADALTKLPEAERAAWQQFWAEVEALRQKAAAANSP